LRGDLTLARTATHLQRRERETLSGLAERGEMWLCVCAVRVRE